MDETAAIKFSISAGDVAVAGASMLCFLVGILLFKFVRYRKRLLTEINANLARLQEEERESLKELLGDEWWGLFERFENITKVLGDEPAVIHAQSIVGNLVARRRHNKALVPPISMEQVAGLAKAFGDQKSQGLNILQRLLNFADCR